MMTHTNSSKDIILNKIKQLGLFQGCDLTFHEKLTSDSHIQTLEKGKILFVHEDKAERFYIILNGWIKLFRETLDGTQAVVDILTKDHLFGETSIFQNDKHPYSAEATEPTTVISLPLSLLKKEIENNQKLALTMLSSMARYRRQQDQELEHRTIQNAPQRIGCFLLRLTNQQQEGKTVIHLPYDKLLVASRLGMQPETFSRALKKLKNETGIKINGASIEVDNLEQLSNYSCAACSSDYPCKDLEKVRSAN